LDVFFLGINARKHLLPIAKTQTNRKNIKKISTSVYLDVRRLNVHR
jgi:hypothetical protein